MFRLRLTLFARAQHTRRMQIHIARDGKQLGPFSLEEINRQLAAGTVSLTDNAWYEGASGWAPLSTVPGVTGGASSSGAAIPAAAAAPMAGSGPVVPTTMVPMAPTEPLAIWSLVLSLVGFMGFCCGGPMLGIAAVICGHLALSKIAANPNLRGRGLAQAGLILGYLVVASWLIYILFFGGFAALQAILDSTHK